MIGRALASTCVCVRHVIDGDASAIGAWVHDEDGLMYTSLVLAIALAGLTAIATPCVRPS